MISWLVRLLLVASGAVAQWFVTADSPNFGLVQWAVALMLLTLIVFVVAYWPRSWSHRLDRGLTAKGKAR